MKSKKNKEPKFKPPKFQCTKCGDIIWSRTEGEFVACSCGYSGDGADAVEDASGSKGLRGDPSSLGTWPAGISESVLSDKADGGLISI